VAFDFAHPPANGKTSSCLQGTTVCSARFRDVTRAGVFFFSGNSGGVVADYSW